MFMSDITIHGSYFLYGEIILHLRLHCIHQQIDIVHIWF